MGGITAIERVGAAGAARRVVTTRSDEGKSVVASDVRVEAITLELMPGSAFHALWASDESPAWFPPAGEIRFALVTIGPSDVAYPADFDLERAIVEVSEKLPGMVEVLEPNNPGMHTTATIDFVVLLQGELVLELDDGAQVALHAGDTVVQNGTRHAWRNPGTTPAVMAVTLVGGLG
ncbi:MAG TPA: cupin domain-containing protein [Acidimicrobiales bacterium]|nr:cupin domain-containing protein [Acidimicrobiales bacterium]